ncbi:MAG TPA: hypothetical protein P5085_03475, partial [Paludibacteraceae bacterium]|nr:hypothetical protein [Paludibacteraceae bacterium]
LLLLPKLARFNAFFFFSSPSVQLVSQTFHETSLLLFSRFSFLVPRTLSLNSLFRTIHSELQTTYLKLSLLVPLFSLALQLSLPRLFLIASIL